MAKTKITITLDAEEAEKLMALLNTVSDEKLALLPPPPSEIDLSTPVEPEKQLYIEATQLRILATHIWYGLNPIPSLSEMYAAERHNLDITDDCNDYIEEE
jgi:hypothetical protein